MLDGFNRVRATLLQSVQIAAADFEKTITHYQGPSRLIPSIFVLTIQSLAHMLDDKPAEACDVLDVVESSRVQLSDAVEAVELIAEYAEQQRMEKIASAGKWKYTAPGEKFGFDVEEEAPKCPVCVAFAAACEDYTDGFEKIAGQFQTYSVPLAGLRAGAHAEAIRDAALCATHAGRMAAGAATLNHGAVSKNHEKLALSIGHFEGRVKGLL